MSKIKKNNNIEYILEKKNNSFITKYGTTSSDEKPKVLYLRTKAKITPSVKKITYETDINIIKSDFNEYVKKTVINSTILYDDYISNIDISSKSVAYGKVSFLRYDIYLKPIIRKTTKDNEKVFLKISEKLDKKLLSLLHKHDISCK